MTWDVTPYQDLIAWAVSEYGETATIKRLSIDYDAVPPEETWSETGTTTIIFQPSAGYFLRRDPGAMARSTHRGLATHDSGIEIGDRIYRSGETDYYRVDKVEKWKIYFEVWMKYVQGAL